MLTWQLVTVTHPLVARYGETIGEKMREEHGGEGLRCQRCDRRLEMGELAWSHYTTVRSSPKPRYYCRRCFQQGEMERTSVVDVEKFEGDRLECRRSM